MSSARTLELLALLELGRIWTSGELAARLRVSARTIRADVERLRRIGYPVEARPGVAGGYRLPGGTAMPPLALSEEEAVAVAVALRVEAARGVTSTVPTSLTALAKLRAALPSHLRHRVDALHRSMLVVPRADGGLDVDVLAALAAAIHGDQRLRFEYTTHHGTQTSRLVEPHRLVNWGERWYLLAWDVERADWRVFRVDRIVPHPPTRRRFRRRVILEDAVIDFVVDRIAGTVQRYRARILVHASAEEVSAKLPVPHEVEPMGPHACQLAVGSDDPDQLALWITRLGMDVEVLEGPELADAFARLAARFTRAAQATGGSDGRVAVRVDRQGQRVQRGDRRS